MARSLSRKVQKVSVLLFMDKLLEYPEELKYSKSDLAVVEGKKGWLQVDGIHSNKWEIQRHG